MPKTTRNNKAIKIDRAALAQDLRAHPDAFQYERAARFGVSQRGIGEALRRLGVTYKKNTVAPQSEHRRTARLPVPDKSA